MDWLASPCSSQLGGIYASYIGTQQERLWRKPSMSPSRADFVPFHSVAHTPSRRSHEEGICQVLLDVRSWRNRAATWPWIKPQYAGVSVAILLLIYLCSSKPRKVVVCRLEQEKAQSIHRCCDTVARAVFVRRTEKFGGGFLEPAYRACIVNGTKPVVISKARPSGRDIWKIW